MQIRCDFSVEFRPGTTSTTVRLLDFADNADKFSAAIPWLQECVEFAGHSVSCADNNHIVMPWLSPLLRKQRLAEKSGGSNTRICYVPWASRLTQKLPGRHSICWLQLHAPYQIQNMLFVLQKPPQGPHNEKSAFEGRSPKLHSLTPSMIIG